MRLARVGVIAFTLAIAASGVAQEAFAQFSGGGGMRGGGMQGQSRGAREQRPDATQPLRRELTDELEERLYVLQDDLRLASTQQALWARYADRVRSVAGDIARDRTHAELRPRVPVLQRLDGIVDSARNRLTALEDIDAAAKSLYETLTPPQRDVADPRLATIVALLMDGTPAPPTAAPPRRP
jgi:hypothetical protein